MQKQLPYLHIPLHGALTENCARQKTKGRQRQTDVEQWEGEMQPNGSNTDSVTPNSRYLTLFLTFVLEQLLKHTSVHA